MSGRTPFGRKQAKKNKRVNKADDEGGNKRAKFVDNDDPYNVKHVDWLEIGKDCDKTRRDLPPAFGNVHSFAKHCHNLKATDWRT